MGLFKNVKNCNFKDPYFFWDTLYIFLIFFLIFNDFDNDDDDDHHHDHDDSF